MFEFRSGMKKLYCVASCYRIILSRNYSLIRFLLIRFSQLLQYHDGSREFLSAHCNKTKDSFVNKTVDFSKTMKLSH